jgi:hypothetical protein
VSQSIVIFSWGQLLYLGLVFFLFYVFELLFFLYKNNKQKNVHQVNDSLSEQVIELKREIEFLKVKVASLSALPLRSKIEFEPLESSLLSNQGAVETPYEQAIRLAQMGAEAAEVASKCGISRGEADLIVAIYRSSERS